MVGNPFEDLSEELKAKLLDCKTKEELQKVLGDASIALDPDVLEAVSGGNGLALTDNLASLASGLDDNLDSASVIPKRPCTKYKAPHQFVMTKCPGKKGPVC